MFPRIINVSISCSIFVMWPRNLQKSISHRVAEKNNNYLPKSYLLVNYSKLQGKLPPIPGGLFDWSNMMSRGVRQTRRDLKWHWQLRSRRVWRTPRRSEEHTSELQSLRHLVCRLL